MQRYTIRPEFGQVKSLAWSKGHLVDFATALSHYIDENNIGPRLKYRFNYPFDAAIVSDDGVYAVLYQKLGTKGVLLKNGDLLREINRSYYYADMYEYPVAFFRAASGIQYLIHCPVAYNQLEFEEVDSGRVVSNIAGRKPADFFHSRLEVSANNKGLLSKGWIWHPIDMVAYFDLEACLSNPLLLDQPIEPPSLDYEVSTASFIHDDLVLLGIKDNAEYFEADAEYDGIKKSQIAVWDVIHQSLAHRLVLDYKIGNIIVVDESHAIDLYKYPKLINFKNGELLDQCPDIDSGLQSSSIIGALKTNLPAIAWDGKNKRLAIAYADTIDVLSI